MIEKHDIHSTKRSYSSFNLAFSSPISVSKYYKRPIIHEKPTDYKFRTSSGEFAQAFWIISRIFPALASLKAAPINNENLIKNFIPQSNIGISVGPLFFICPPLCKTNSDNVHRLLTQTSSVSWKLWDKYRAVLHVQGLVETQEMAREVLKQNLFFSTFTPKLKFEFSAWNVVLVKSSQEYMNEYMRHTIEFKTVTIFYWSSLVIQEC